LEQKIRKEEEMMKTYNFEAMINEGGIIVLPDYMKKLMRHRVRLTISDLEKTVLDAKNISSEIAGECSRPDEEDTLLGLFWDEPELMDEITESAMRSREKNLLRYKNG